MKPSALTYHRPTSLDAALALLADLGPDAKVLAGGQSLVPLLSMRLAAPAHVVDIGALPDLAGITVGADGVRVGALARQSQLERHEGAAAAQPLLREAVRHVAHPTIRNRGTTIGSLVHADPSGELPAVLTLLGGSVYVVSTRGPRTIPAGLLFVGPLECSLAPDELAVGALFPRSGPRTGTALVEIARRNGDYAVVGVVASVTLDRLGAPVRAAATYVTAGRTGAVVDLTAHLTDDLGVEPVADWAARAATAAAGLVETEGDVHASAAYRTHLVDVLTGRALGAAAERARAALGRRVPA